MRCPKCHYISFESGERCRNCGYDFSLAIDPREADFPLQEEPEGPLADFNLNHLDDTPQEETPTPQPDVAEPPPARPAVGTAGLELPLFQPGADDGRPLVTPSPTPRPPLAVRRATPSVPRLRERSAVEPPPRLQWDSDGDLARQPTGSAPPGPVRTLASADTCPPTADGRRRSLAALVDLLVLGGIDLGVLYFTLQLSGLAWSELGTLPWVPVVAFLLLLNGGYLVAFTAAVGQTIGKMAFGIRVASIEPPGDASPSPQQAVLRAAALLVSAIPLGVGFLPALFSDDRRALHDRIAGTRVVNAGRPSAA